MKRFKKFVAATVLVFVMALSTAAGEVGTGGVTAPPPPPQNGSTTESSATLGAATSGTDAEIEESLIAEFLNWLVIQILIT